MKLNKGDRDAKGRFLKSIHIFCTIEGCENKHKAKGLCKYHYNKQIKQRLKEHYKKWHKQYYIKNIDKWREKTEERRIMNKIRYHSSPEENLKMNVSVSKSHVKYYRTKKTWRDKVLRQSKKEYFRRQNISLKTASKGRTKWTDSEIDYLSQNYKKMTYLELAIKLQRTHGSIHAKRLDLFPPKNRRLQGIYYKLLDNNKSKEDDKRG